MKFRVRTPATVANLGPGFDCLGLALDLWNEMIVETTGDRLEITIEGEGFGTLPVDETNAIYRTMGSFARQHGKDLPAGIQIQCRNGIPLGSGLGSSSAATVAGILAAVSLLDLPEDRDEQLQFATQMEGHPDNITPCLLGGFTMSLVDNDKAFARKLPIHPLPLVIVTPEFYFPTSQARAVLPNHITRQDAVFNLSHAAFLIDALRTGEIELLSLASEDRLHQPYRLPLIPGAADVITAARNAGALAVVLAGAGPSLLAFCRDSTLLVKVGESMRAAFKTAGLNARIYTPSIINKGATVHQAS